MKTAVAKGSGGNSEFGTCPQLLPAAVYSSALGSAAPVPCVGLRSLLPPLVPPPPALGAVAPPVAECGTRALRFVAPGTAVLQQQGSNLGREACWLASVPELRGNSNAERERGLAMMKCCKKGGGLRAVWPSGRGLALVQKCDNEWCSTKKPTGPRPALCQIIWCNTIQPLLYLGSI